VFKCLHIFWGEVTKKAIWLYQAEVQNILQQIFENQRTLKSKKLFPQMSSAQQHMCLASTTT
jgi:hypothetical protein